MPTPAELLRSFAEAWTTGERPDVDAYLDRADPADRDELATQLHAYLLDAPTPLLSDAAREEIAGDPLVQRLAGLTAAPDPWPVLLPALRNRAKLLRAQVVDRLADALGVGASREKVGSYYHELETGTLDPEGVSRRVVDALAGIFGMDRDELDRAGTYSGLELGTQAAFARERRGDDGGFGLQADLSVPPPAASEALHSGAAPAWDDVDDLFRGGR